MKHQRLLSGRREEDPAAASGDPEIRALTAEDAHLIPRGWWRWREARQKGGGGGRGGWGGGEKKKKRRRRFSVTSE